MKTKPFNRSRAFHLLAGGVAAALAIGPFRNSKWRYPLYSLAGLELVNGIMADSPAEHLQRMTASPELIRTDVVNGIRMRWEDHGSRSADSLPIVMVHGLPTNPRVWRYVIPQVVKTGVRCLAWEQVGFGWSMKEGLGKDISIPKQAEYLYDWLQHLGISKAIFVAHDYGGGVVQRLLVNHPEIAMGLVLSDSVAYENWPVTAVRMAQSMSPAIESLPPRMIKPILYAAVSNLGHSNSSIKKESFQLYWEPYNQNLGPKALVHQLRHFHSEDTQKNSALLEEPDLSIPARVVWGGKDPLGLDSATKLALALNAPLIKIDGGRHFTIEDHPEVIAKAIVEVMNEVMVIA